MSRRSFLCVLAVYVATRIALLLASFDEFAIPNFELGVAGNLARLASTGEFGVPLHEYFDNVGGHLLVGLLATPIYAVVGDTYLSLKLVLIALGVGTLALLIVLLERIANARAAWIGAVLFIVAPPTLLKYSLLATGNHFECLFFQLAAYALFCRAHATARPRPWLHAAALASGLATFVYVGSLLLVLGIASAHVAIVGWRRAVGDMARVVPSFVLGLAPLLMIAAAPGGRFQQFLSAKVAPIDASSFSRAPARIGQLLGEVLPNAGGWRDLGGLSKSIPETAWLVAFVLAWTVVMLALASRARIDGRERTRSLLLWPVCSYTPLFALVFAVSTFEFAPYSPPMEVGRFRYLVPHALFAIVLISVAVTHASDSLPRARAARWSISALAALTALWTAQQMISTALTSPSSSRHVGSHFPYFANVLFKHSVLDPETGRRQWDDAWIRATVEGLPDSTRHATYLGVGHHLARVQMLRSTGDVSAETPGLALSELLEPYPPHARIDLALGVGSNLRRMFEFDANSRAQAAHMLEVVELSCEPLAPYVVEGLCSEFGFELESHARADLELSRAVSEYVDSAQRGVWLRGFGRQCGRMLGRGLPHELEQVHAQMRAPDIANSEAFWFGVGWGLAEQDDRARALARLLDEVGASTRSSALRGFGAGLRHLEGPSPACENSRAAFTRASTADVAEIESGRAWPEYPRPSCAWPGARRELGGLTK